nr:hypothetical protein BaRGS_032439 [Batillaria attramentaria]
MDLEEREQQLSEELESVRQTAQEKELCDKDVDTSDLVTPTTGSTKKPESNDIAVDTEDLQEQTTTKVSELFGRVQELETANQRLMSRSRTSQRWRGRQEATSRETAAVGAFRGQAYGACDGTRGERGDASHTGGTTSRKRAEIADELEEEISVMLQQEDEWKEKRVASLSEKILLFLQRLQLSKASV